MSCGMNMLRLHDAQPCCLYRGKAGTDVAQIDALSMTEFSNLPRIAGVGLPAFGAGLKKRGVRSGSPLSRLLGMAQTTLPRQLYDVRMSYIAVIAATVFSKLLIFLASPTGFEPVLSP